jgi:hypothetical protein
MGKEYDAEIQGSLGGRDILHKGAFRFRAFTAPLRMTPACPVKLAG